MIPILLGSLLSGCNVEETKPQSSVDGEFLIDGDGDGFIAAEDCDDASATTNPSAEEVCDGFDNDCDGQFDEDVLTDFFGDSDSDGFGNPDLVYAACEAPEGYVSNGSDCDDADESSHPSAEEVCDTIDNNCNGEADEGLSEDFYADEDEDGYGDSNTIIQACILAPGLSIIEGDCDDTDSELSPDSAEICDGIDNNCSGEIDEGVATSWYPDADEDGYGDELNAVEACDAPEGYIDRGGDCDDLES
jgi:large repetitive protein